MLAVEMYTPCTLILLAVEKVRPARRYAGCGNVYTLHVDSAGGGKGYALHVDTAGCRHACPGK
jgi:hypothetical protein